MNTNPPTKIESDPQLNALLDEALGWQSVSTPDNLTERIISQTVDNLESGHRHVVGRINLASRPVWAAAFAALVLLAAGAAMWMTIPVQQMSPSDMFFTWDDKTEQELELLALEIDELQIANNWDPVRSDLDQELTQWDLGIAENDLVTEF